MKYVITLCFFVFSGFVHSEQNEIVGKKCDVDAGYVVVEPLHEKVEQFPSELVKKNLVGGGVRDLEGGEVIFKTIYSPSANGYWNHREIYIVREVDAYYLATAEGIQNCR